MWYNTGNEFLEPGEGVPTTEKEKIFDLGFGLNTGLGVARSRKILAITGITIRETSDMAREPISRWSCPRVRGG